MRLQIVFNIFSLLCLTACYQPPYHNVTNIQLQTLLEQGIPIYDVRRPDEWQQTGVIQGSQLLTFVDASGQLTPDFFEKFTLAVNQHDPVILICRTGNRSSILALYLVEKLGYTSVYNVRNGIVGWISDGGLVTQIY